MTYQSATYKTNVFQPIMSYDVIPAPITSGEGVNVEEVNQLITQYMSTQSYVKEEDVANRLKKQVVNELPTSNIDENTIYMKVRA